MTAACLALVSPIAPVPMRSCFLPVLAAFLLLPIAALAQPTGDLDALSDEFESAASLSDWTRLADVEGWTDKLKTLDVDDTAPGALYLEPYPSVWFYDYTAPLLFKTVDGNFMVTTRINVSGHDGAMPSTTYSLAGLMARRPRSEAPFRADSAWAKDRENYVFLVTGTTGEPGAPKIETKSAVRSRPIVKHYPRETSGWIELRLVRLGETIIALYRRPEGDWQIHERFYRPNLPGTLQVGLMAYGDYATVREQTWYDPWPYNTSVIREDADMRVEADYVRFRRPALSDAAQAFVDARNLHWDDHRISNDRLVALCPFLVE
jgi:hypothetical protein